MRFLFRRSARRAATAAASLALCTGGLVVGGAGTAEAAAICAGNKIDTLEFYSGYTYLYYSSATGMNCAYTVPKSGSGTRQFMHVGLFRQSDGAGVWDSGQYTQYAGPVYLHAPGTCVSFNGQVASWSGNSGYGHCGSLALTTVGFAAEGADT
ncbi:hypothetical protein H0H10_36865 [Streptomyces sp. TRM S81-3]|uniref:Spore-associated protein A n=1 Tax=Streptomyces griseicoloratus TaxID=2752516 RepID=A0A926LDP4_9ACTN|nr:hypothetical protein [Streptomyces griseicoloratus]MBD0424677.1 hypothetical protein [Streptomyces griseicoloratus]